MDVYQKFVVNGDQGSALNAKNGMIYFFRFSKNPFFWSSKMYAIEEKNRANFGYVSNFQLTEKNFFLNTEGLSPFTVEHKQ